MEIRDFLSLEHVLVDAEASDKVQLIEALAARAASALRLEGGVIVSAVAKREALGSTGVGGGIALPHARIDGLKRPFGLLARVAAPIEFDAVDGKPVDVVFMLLLPASSHGEQLNILASVARKLREGEVLQKIRSATDTAEVFRAIAG